MSEAIRAHRDARRAQWELENGVTHRDGIPWHDAPIPRRWHTCTPQTTASHMGVLRCACGAIASLLGPWQEKNSRRKQRRSA